MGLKAETDKLDAAGKQFLQYLTSNRYRTEECEQVRLIIHSTMVLITTVLANARPALAADASPSPEDQRFSSTAKNSTHAHRPNFNDTVSAILPLVNPLVVTGEVQEEDVVMVFQSFNRSREARCAILANVAEASDYEQLEQNVRTRLATWTSSARSFSTIITDVHRQAIADFVSVNWIRRRRCVSIEIFKSREMWCPLVESVFSKESQQEKTKLVEFFRKSISQHNNKLKPIWSLIIGLHDNHCNCRAGSAAT